MINIIIPQIITQIEIIIPACWNVLYATAQPCRMGKGEGGFIQQMPEGGSEEGESDGEAAGGQALGDGAAAAYERKRKPKLPALSGFSCG